MKFAVIADSHFRVDGDARQDAHPSDPTHNARNRRVVELLRVAAPEFVVHLGDVPHPVPRLTAQHATALAEAQRTYAPLAGTPLYVVPGNHDVGDKPRPWANAPGATAPSHAAFTETWGPPWGSFDHGPVHGVWIDTPILGTGSAMEAEQWAWLEADLAAAHAAGRRIFVFVHYPPYLCTRDEEEHYDNLAEPGRTRLLDLLAAHRAEALFAGHVHRRFWDRHDQTDLYIAPSTAFVRPEYAELSRVAPGAESGRDDPDLLGFFVVHVDDDGHHLEQVRALDAPLADATALHPRLRPGAAAPPPLGLGVFLRHDLTQPADVPYASLDEFARKWARPDEALYALWDLGVEHLRVPLTDLRRPQARARWLALADRGARLTVFGAGAPTARDAATVEAHAPWLAAWEIVVPRGLAVAAAASLRELAVRVPAFLSAAGHRHADPNYFSHFPPHGFDPDEALVSALLAAEGAPGVVFRASSDPIGTLAAVAARVAGRPAMVHVELPRGEEGCAATDDVAAAAHAVATLLAARAHPSLRVFADTFMDHDRGYWPRQGLVDRRGVPRAAGRALRHRARLLPSLVELTRGADPDLVGVARVGVIQLARAAAAVAAPEGAHAAVDLITGVVRAVHAGRPIDLVGPTLWATSPLP